MKATTKAARRNIRETVRLRAGFPQHLRAEPPT
jgi:hypothetical protein